MLELLEPSWSLAGALTLITGLLAVFYDMSPQFRYYFKFVMFIIMVSCSVCVVLPMCIIRPKDVRNVWAGIPFIHKISSILGITWEVRGEEHLAKDAPCIVVCNHQSMLDFLGMAAVWPAMKKCAAVGKRLIMYIPPFGLIAYLSGTVFIDRSKSAESRSTISASAQSIHESKTKLWIFPEGTRSKGKKLLPFKKGAFYIAVENKLPIVPVLMSPYTFVDDEKKVFDSGRMIVQVLPPIETDNFELKDVGKLTEMTQNIMSAEYEKLCKEVESFAESSRTKQRNETVFNLDLKSLKT